MIKPIRDLIAIAKPAKVEEQILGGIVIPTRLKDGDERKTYFEAVVIAVGGAVEHVKVGDKIVLSSFAGTEHSECVLIRECEVLGIRE